MTSNGLEFHSHSLFKNQESIHFRNLVKIHNAMVQEGVNSVSQKSQWMMPEKPRSFQISVGLPESSNPGSIGIGYTLEDSFDEAQQTA